MPKSSGWIKQHRKEIHSEIFAQSPLYYKVWQYLKMSVDRKTGALITSIGQIAQGVEWTEKGVWRTPNKRTIMRILDWMVEQNMLIKLSNGTGTTLTLTNWDTYQSAGAVKVTASAQVNAQVNAQPYYNVVQEVQEVQEEEPTNTTEADPIGQQAQASPDSNGSVTSQNQIHKPLNADFKFSHPSSAAHELYQWTNQNVLQKNTGNPQQTCKRLDVYLRTLTADQIQMHLTAVGELEDKKRSWPYVFGILDRVKADPTPPDGACPKCGVEGFGLKYRDSWEYWGGTRLAYRCKKCNHAEKSEWVAPKVAGERPTQKWENSQGRI